MRMPAVNAAPSLQEQNLITHVHGITFGLQTTALNGNCTLARLARSRLGHCFDCALAFWLTTPAKGSELKRTDDRPMHHGSPLCSRISGRCNSRRPRLSIKPFRCRHRIPALLPRLNGERGKLEVITRGSAIAIFSSDSASLTRSMDLRADALPPSCSCLSLSVFRIDR